MIKCIKVQGGITKIGNQLFLNCNAVQKVSISQSVKVIVRQRHLKNLQTLMIFPISMRLFG